MRSRYQRIINGHYETQGPGDCEMGRALETRRRTAGRRDFPGMVRDDGASGTRRAACLPHVDRHGGYGSKHPQNSKTRGWRERLE